MEVHLLFGILYTYHPYYVKKSLARLRFFSMIIVAIIIYTILVAVAQSPYFYESYKDHKDYHVDWVVADFTPKWFKGFGTIMLSFHSQILFFYVRGELMQRHLHTF